MTHRQASNVVTKSYTSREITALIQVLGIALSRQFEEAEIALIQSLLQDFSLGYEEISQRRGYSKNYLRGQVGPRLWQDLSSIFRSSFGKPINKTNFERFICYLINQISREIQFDQEDAIEADQIRDALGLPSIPVEKQLSDHPDLGQINQEATSRFYGRNAELDTLTHLLSAYQCVSVVGAIGTGKTSLASHWVQQFGRSEFDVVVWRSMIHAPTSEILTQDLLGAIQTSLGSSKVDLGKSSSSSNHQISTLMTLLQQHRCLLVLDSAESIIQSTAISTLNPYGELQDYTQFIRYVSEQQHQSCLLLLSRQRFNQVVRLNHSNRSAQEMMLAGLAPEAAQHLLEDFQLKDRSSWGTLIDLYQGNPGLLIQISRYIQACFGSQVRHFLRCNTIIVPDEASNLYLAQIQRLSVEEQVLLFHLATQTTSVQITELFNVLKSRSILIKSLTRLVELCLVERREIESELRFNLSPVVRKVILTHPIQSHPAGRITKPV